MVKKVKSRRYDELKAMLKERRREVLGEVQEKMRDARTKGAEQHNSNAVRDPADVAMDDVREDIEFILIQMKAETLTRIDQALGQLDQGTYGNCFECGGEIAEARLRALPFAVRCKDCEETLEAAEQRERARRRRNPRFGISTDVDPQFDS